MRIRPLATGLAALALLGAVADPADRLSDPTREARAHSLFREIRCLVCQGESIAESEAPLAADMRRLVREQVRAGRSDGEIRAYLKDRYGPFVLLRPPFSTGNALLWLSPFVAAGIGWLLLLRRRPAESDLDLSPEEEARLAELDSHAPF